MVFPNNEKIINGKLSFMNPSFSSKKDQYPTTEWDFPTMKKSLMGIVDSFLTFVVISGPQRVVKQCLSVRKPD